jgi:hypothetical protein
MQKPHLSEKRQWCPFPIISPLTPHTRARAMSAPTGDAKRVYKLALGGDAKKQRYVVETRVAGGGRLGVILIGLKSPERVLVSTPASGLPLTSNEFVCADEDVERELLRAGAIRITREVGGRRACALDDGEGAAAVASADGEDGATRTRDDGTSRGVVGGRPPVRMEGVKNEEVLGMLSGIMKGASPRVVRRGDAGASPREIGGASVGGGGGGAGVPRAKVPMLTPRTMRGGAGASRGTGAGGGGATPSPSASALPLGTFGADATTFYSPTSSFASPAASESRSGGGDDYLESMMSDFSAALLGSGSAAAANAAAGLPPGFGAPTATGTGVSRHKFANDASTGEDRELSPFFTPSDAPASGALVGALEAGVDVAPLEDVSGLQGDDGEVDVSELTRESSSGALGLDATPAELSDLLNRSRMLRVAADSLDNDALGLEEVKSAPLFEENLERSSSKGEICEAYNLRGDKFGCEGCVSRHVCQLCESPRHVFGTCPQLFANVHRRVEKNVCIDYYLNSIDETGCALRSGWDQENHAWNLCPRGADCMLEHVCGCCGKSGTNAHTPSCRLYALFAKPGSLDLCRKYYLHSLGDYFKTETDGSYKFKIGSSGGWALCAKGDRCHSRHICGHCGEEGRGKHKESCKLYGVCGDAADKDEEKQPCFLYFMKSMVGIREFEKGLLGGSARGFCSQKKGECTGYHVCGTCGKKDVSPYNADGHDASCRMRTISNESDPTLNPRTKQLLKDFEEEIARVRADNKEKDAKQRAPETPKSAKKSAKGKEDSDEDDDAPVKIDVKRCRVLKSEIDAMVRGLSDAVDVMCEEAVERAGQEIPRNANPTHKLEKIRDGIRDVM